MDEVFNKLNDMKITSILLREIGKDSIIVADKVDDYLMFSTNPVRMCLSNDLENNLDKKVADIEMSMMMLLNKLEILGNHLDFIKEEGDEENE